MPTYIIKLDTPVGPRYLDYSTVCDAPITYGMTLDEFKTYYRDEYGRAGAKDLDDRLSRVEAKGTSSHIHANLAALLRSNRAGRGETCLTIEQIVDYYAVRRGKGAQPVGKTIDPETDS